MSLDNTNNMYIVTPHSSYFYILVILHVTLIILLYKSTGKLLVHYKLTSKQCKAV